MNDKASLRKVVRERFRSSPDGRSFLTEALRQRIDASKTLFAFMSLGSEPDTGPILEYAIRQDLTVAVPAVRGKDMVFRAIDSPKGPFVTASFGIREPPQDAPEIYPAGNPEFPVLVLVPALAFSPDGKRLGRGGGFYDRFLSSFLERYADRRGQILLAGLCGSERIIDGIPTERHDISVDCLLTEKGCILGV